MAEESQSDVEDKNILYDLSIHAEWPQETESTVRAISFCYLFALFINASVFSNNCMAAYFVSDERTSVPDYVK